jgi:hypothetical protein
MLLRLAKSRFWRRSLLAKLLLAFALASLAGFGLQVLLNANHDLGDISQLS